MLMIVDCCRMICLFLFWCFTPLSTISRLYCGDQLLLVEERSQLQCIWEETTGLLQVNWQTFSQNQCRFQWGLYIVPALKRALFLYDKEWYHTEVYGYIMAIFNHQNLTAISQHGENGDDIVTSLASPSKYPRYTDTASRVESFAKWIKKQTPKIMADAGFFFENQGDKVKCFHCGIMLTSWDPQVDPWLEHAWWSPSCEYLIALKGQQFVSLMSSSQSTSCHQHQSENEEPSVSESHSNEPPNEQISDMTSTNTAYKYPESTLRKHPLLTDAAQSVLEMGYLPRDIKIAVEQVLETLGWQQLRGENILDVLMDMEESGMIKSDSRHEFDHSTLTRVSLDDMSDEQLTEQKRKLEDEIKENNEKLQCKICCDLPVSIVFLKCGHLVCCAQCAPAMKLCPVCREKVKATVRINLNRSNTE